MASSALGSSFLPRSLPPLAHEQTRELLELRYVRQRMTETVELLQSGLYVLALCQKVKNYVEHGHNDPSRPDASASPDEKHSQPYNKFYSAIKVPPLTLSHIRFWSSSSIPTSAVWSTTPLAAIWHGALAPCASSSSAASWTTSTSGLSSSASARLLWATSR